jgi:hypothetical protein
MIKFFRRIRQQLLAEGKTAKYFKYAIGEILLVMIGILLALQVNNWNEERKDRIQEQVLLRQLQTEFKSNLDQLNQKIAIRQEIILSATKLLGYIDDPATRQKDSINRYLALSVGYTTFDPIVSDLANSGGLRLLRNNSLKQLLSYWTSEIMQVTESEQTWYKYRNEVYVPFLITHYQIRTARHDLIKTDYLKKYQSDKGVDSYLYKIGGIGPSKYPEDYNQLLDQPDFEDHLTRCIVTNNICDVQSIILRNRIVEILELISTEIED